MGDVLFEKCKGPCVLVLCVTKPNKFTSCISQIGAVVWCLEGENGGGSGGRMRVLNRSVMENLGGGRGVGREAAKNFACLQSWMTVLWFLVRTIFGLVRGLQ